MIQRSSSTFYEQMRRLTLLRPLQQGLTLIALLITMLVLAIVVSIAALPFTSLIARDRVDTRDNELLVALQSTQAESIRTNQPVLRCAFVDGLTCTGRDWQRWRARTASGNVVCQGRTSAQVAMVAACALVGGGIMALGSALHGSVGNVRVNEGFLYGFDAATGTETLAFLPPASSGHLVGKESNGWPSLANGSVCRRKMEVTSALSRGSLATAYGVSWREILWTGYDGHQ